MKIEKIKPNDKDNTTVLALKINELIDSHNQTIGEEKVFGQCAGCGMMKNLPVGQLCGRCYMGLPEKDTPQNSEWEKEFENSLPSLPPEMIYSIMHNFRRAISKII